jgi:hypothetical protein
MPLIRHMRVVASTLVVLGAASFGCGKNGSPTSPSPAPSTPTRIISVSGDLAFGNVDVNTSASRPFVISNSGNSTLTFTGLQAAGGTGTSGWAASPTSGTVPAGGSLTGTLRFSPTLAQAYNTTLTVVGDQTSGNAGIAISGTGVNNTPIFSITGTGDTVFDMPLSVAKVHVVGTFNHSSCSNFIVKVAGRLLVNEIIGNCSIGIGPTYEGTLLTGGGGQVAITNSSGVEWSFTEVR